MKEVFSARLNESDCKALKDKAAERGISASRLANEILTAILPQIKADVKFVWLSIENIGK